MMTADAHYFYKSGYYTISGPQGKQNLFSYITVSQQTLYQDKEMYKSLFGMLDYIENNLTILTRYVRLYWKQSHNIDPFSRPQNSF